MKTKTVLITGASSGIGLELAKQFARGGWNLVLVARREPELRDLAASLKVQTQVVVADLTRVEERKRLIEMLRETPVDCLVNNAGFADYSPFAKADWDKNAALLHLNIEALTHLTHAFLPGMIERKRGRILNVASTAAFFPGPGMATYYASKAFVLSFSEALATEVEGSGVSVTCLCPGATTSEFQERANMQESKVMDVAMMSSAEVARAGYKAAIRGQRLVIPGTMNILLTLLPRVLSRKRIALLVRDVQAPQSDH
jgi:short-subunit dehydrogenase